MSILLLGDIHGNTNRLFYALEIAKKTDASAVVQLGDFGLFPQNEQKFYEICQHDIPVYFVCGNHDDCTRWVNFNQVTKVFPDSNLWYIPRGTVMELDGRTIAFMGGAASIDKGYRLQRNMHWDHNENITPEHMDRLLKNAEGKTIDLFITHCPPNSVIEEHFDNSNKLYFGVGLDWVDPNQSIIEELWHKLGTPMVYSGHMHRRVVGQTYRILDIDELLGI